ncbi:hypothetical protein Tco_0842709 [Tanacetum coccineum]|uniref:Uncharacterized protein n=1 Tax=Tanacetum coccineum TaxID=301880 RepID=A0ABQ5B3I7_9ASTR
MHVAESKSVMAYGSPKNTTQKFYVQSNSQLNNKGFVDSGCSRHMISKTLMEVMLLLEEEPMEAELPAKLSESSTSSQQDQENQDCIVMPIWKDASYFGAATPRSVVDAQIQNKDGLHDKNDAAEMSHNDSSLKDNSTTVQQVHTARPKINTSSIEVSTAVPEVNTATPEDLVGPSHASEDTQVEDQEIELGNIPQSYTIIDLSQRLKVSPKTSHLLAVKRIFRYLKGKPSLGLWYSKDSPLELVAYTDSDYAGATQDRKSTTGGCQFLGNRLISWQCKKQTVVATSTTEAEYVAAASCCGQVLWIQNQLLDYGYNFMNTIIYIDNNSTICIIENPVQHSKTKHIEIRHHFIKDCNAKKLIQMAKIDSEHNVADLLTKGFDAGRFQYLVSSIGMLNP